jgi:opine dehydrogenase
LGKILGSCVLDYAILNSLNYIKAVHGLVLYSSLGKRLNIPTPASDAIITLGGMLLGRNFFEEGITLQKLGFGELDAEGLVAAVS